MKAEIKLRYSPRDLPVPAAWFLPGTSADRWLEALSRAGLALAGTRLFVVPRSSAEAVPAGLLALPPSGHRLVEVPSGIPCRQVGERLFIPSDAALDPPLNESELRDLFPHPVAFFHPVFGLSGFDEKSTLHVWDLISVPSVSGEDWNWAQIGVAPLPQLVAVVLSQPMGLADLFGGAAGQIGIEPVKDLPPAPDEPKENILAKSKRQIWKTIASGVSNAVNHLPKTAPQPTWANHMADWANRKASGTNKELERIRNKELHRLLHLLAQDPEAGLRHAIPLSAFAHRGTAAPGGQLGPRSTDFNSGRFGGHPADFWNVPPDLEADLRNRYREMAGQEMLAGRHRRAAYIYAELLGDIPAAAHCLKQGGYFREAAVLFEEHLKNPLEAARCLAEGGFLGEAIERYEKLQLWLDAAALYERAGNASAAEAAVRRVIQDRLDLGDLLGAAKLLDERLHSSEEALETLFGGWPSSHQAVGCVAAAFKIMARLGRHAEVLKWVERLGQEKLPASLIQPVLAVLGETAGSYPDLRVRHRSADLSRVMVGRQLASKTLPGATVAELCNRLIYLASGDRLLARDAARYQAERRAADAPRRALPPPLPKRQGNKPDVFKRIKLPPGVRWMRLRRDFLWFFAAGFSKAGLTVVRGSWDGGLQTISWNDLESLDEADLFFEPVGDRGQSVTVALMSGVRFAEKRFPAADNFGGHSCVVGSPAWLSGAQVPLALSDEAIWTVHSPQGDARLIVSCHDRAGKLHRTLDLTESLFLDNSSLSPGARLRAAVMTSGVALALGNRLLLCRTDGKQKIFELPGLAVELAGTLPHTRAGVAVMLDHGAVMIWDGKDEVIEIDRDISSPTGAFVPGGPLVLVSGHEVISADVSSSGIKSLSRMTIEGAPVIGISATVRVGEFAILRSDGDMTVYRSRDS